MSPLEYQEILHKNFPHETSESSFYKIGGHTFEIQFPSKHFKNLYKAPFQKSSESADFTLYVWDSRVANQKKLSPGWHPNAYAQKGEIPLLSQGKFRAVYDAGAATLSFANLQERKGYCWTPDLQQRPYWEKGSPLRNLIHWFLPLKRKYLVHGACIGTRKKGVLIVGKGGSGKSTTALSCLNTPLFYCGDDYCALSNDPAPQVYNIYTSAKIATKSNHLKDIIAIDQEKLIENIALSAIIFPKIGPHANPKIAPTSKGNILRELAASTIFQLPGKNGEMLSFFKNIVLKVPCYTLFLSPQREKNSQYLWEFLHD